ncbi:HAD family phosphatase [Streptomyces sp. NPDC001984]
MQLMQLMQHPGLRTLRLAAVNVDGVLLNDTFSPVIHRLVVKHGVVYTPELEKAVLSQPRERAARVLAGALGAGAGGPQQIAEAFFEERERYMRSHPLRPLDGAGELLRRLRALGLAVVCYGGMDARFVEEHLAVFRPLLAAPHYIATDGFRPGIREITEDHFALARGQVLFIDDAVTFAERARELDVPFIGHPSGFEHGFQRRLMREAGVRHTVRSLHEIDERLVRVLDREAYEGTVWQESRRPAGPVAGARGARP